MNSKVIFYLVFYRSTLLVSVSIAILIGIMSVGEPLDVWIKGLGVAYLGFGFGVDYLYKQLTRKNEYYFYYNAGCGKFELWAATFVIASALYAFVVLISTLLL